MKEVLTNIFKNYKFSSIEIKFEKFNAKVCTNEKSETYILIFVDEITNDLPNKIFNLCAEDLYKTNELSRAQKSNLSVIIIAKNEEELSKLQKNIIYKIEESALYYKKFVLWYSEQELEDSKKIIGNDYTSNSLNNKLVNKKLFEKFKSDEGKSKGYSLLSRIYIKLPFLTLSQIVTMNRTLPDYANDSLDKVKPGLFKTITDNVKQDEIIDNSIKFFDLSEKELNEIKKELELVVNLDE